MEPETTNRVMTHDFWLTLFAFVSFVLAATGTSVHPRVNLLGLGAALIALALLW
jgi:hypothetical protein